MRIVPPQELETFEERVVSQFLRELDGLQSGEGVLLVGATNRPDIIDDAVRERRMVPIEVPLPDAAGRLHLLEVLCREVQLGPDVNLEAIAAATDGMSGANLKQIRNSAGMKALTRSAHEDQSEEPAVMQSDFAVALAERGLTLAGPAEPSSRRASPKKDGKRTNSRTKSESGSKFES